MKEFLEALKEERVRKWISTILDVESTEVKALFDLLAGSDGEISRAEFVQGMKAVRGGARAIDMMMMYHHTRKGFKDVNEKLNRMSRTAVANGTEAAPRASCARGQGVGANCSSVGSWAPSGRPGTRLGPPSTIFPVLPTNLNA